MVTCKTISLLLPTVRCSTDYPEEALTLRIADLPHKTLPYLAAWDQSWRASALCGCRWAHPSPSGLWPLPWLFCLLRRRRRHGGRRQALVGQGSNCVVGAGHFEPIVCSLAVHVHEVAQMRLLK